MAVAPELASPGKEFLLIESEVFADLHVWDRICSCSLVEPTFWDTEQGRRFVDREQTHIVGSHDDDEDDPFASRR